MKTPHFFLFIGLLYISFYSNAAEKTYTIIASAKDTSLTDSTAIVTFTFVNKLNEPLQIPVIPSYNYTLYLKSADTQGNITMPLKSGKYLFSFQYKKGILPSYLDESTYFVSTDSILVKAGFRMTIRINLGNVPSEKDKQIVKKPVVYFYPEQKQAIDVTLKTTGQLLFSYPTYNHGWSFTAEPNGNIHINGKQYRYLFWEAATDNIKTHFDATQGFVIAQNQLLTFLEDKLQAMGFNASEQQDFITYWYPQMAKNAYSYIYFMFNQSCDQLATFDISPQPKQLFRVYMLWAEVPDNQIMQPAPQTIPLIKREGFHVVEWGGIELQPSTLFPTTQQ